MKEEGLSSAEAAKRLAKYGPYVIVEKEINLARKLLQHFTGPIAYMIEAAAIVSAIIGHWDDFVIITGLLLLGVRLLSHPLLQQYFGLADQHQLQTVMFLQLVVGGHLLLFVTRTERWFFLPPYPAVPLVVAIFLTQVVAVLMCGFGWLVPPIPWSLIGWVWVYNIAWMFVLGGVRLLTERFAASARPRPGSSIASKAIHHRVTSDSPRGWPGKLIAEESCVNK